MRDIVWTDEAIEHLEAIVAYIAAFNPAAADRLGGRLIEAANGLAEFLIVAAARWAARAR